MKARILLACILICKNQIPKSKPSFFLATEEYQAYSGCLAQSWMPNFLLIKLNEMNPTFCVRFLYG